MNENEDKRLPDDEPQPDPVVDQQIHDGIPHGEDAPPYDPFTSPHGEDLINDPEEQPAALASDSELASAEDSSSEETLAEETLAAPEEEDPEAAPSKVAAETAVAAAAATAVATKSVAPKGASGSKKAKAAAQVEPDELEKAILWFKENSKVVSAAVILILVGSLAVNFYAHHRSNSRNIQSLAFDNAGDPVALRNVMANYPGSDVATLASFTLGGREFEAGNHTAAKEAFDAFVQQHPRHVLSFNARVGAAQCLLALGQAEQALKSFEALAQEQPEHYLKGDIHMGRIRALKDLNRLEDARVVAENFIASEPGRVWLQLAQQQMDSIDRLLHLAGKS